MVLVDDEGQIVVTSPLSFSFRFPLVETTVDPQTRTCYVITYPSDATGAVLSALRGSDLSVAAQWRPASLQLFDLQYSVGQQALYGIAVQGRYGRVLSQFALTPADISARSIAALPFMWYVNASSFDQQRGRYFGLLNNFPGQPNSTLAQKLAVGLFAQQPPTALFLDLVPAAAAAAAPDAAVPSVSFVFDASSAASPMITTTTTTSSSLSSSGLLLYFIAWSAPAQTLVGLAATDAGVALVNISTDTGSYEPLLEIKHVDVGPMVAEAEEAFVRLFVHVGDGYRMLVRVDLQSRGADWLGTLNKAVAAATLAPWVA